MPCLICGLHDHEWHRCPHRLPALALGIALAVSFAICLHALILGTVS
jgi:hypothetical protein